MNYGERVEKEWEAISKGVMQDLIASMPRRCAAVVEAKSGHTKDYFVMLLMFEMGSKKTVWMC